MMGAAIVLAFLAPWIPQDSANEGIDRQVRFLTQYLNLSEDQAEKVRGVLKRQSDDLREALTEEQRERYDRLGRGRSSRGRSRRGWWPSTDELREQLTLSDDQAKSVEQVRESIRDEFRTFWQDRRPSENARAEWEAFQKKLREENTAKIRDLLNEGQKARFDKVMAEFNAQASGGDGTRGRSASRDDRVDRVMELLKIENAEEAAAIRTLVVNVTEASRRLSEAQREARTKYGESLENAGLSDEALGKQIVEVQSGLRKLEKALASARQALAEVLTNRQEAELLRRGILR